MTQYLSGRPFSVATGSKVTELQYDLATGRLIHCPTCGEYVKPEHVCPEKIDGEN